MYKIILTLVLIPVLSFGQLKTSSTYNAKTNTVNTFTQTQTFAAIAATAINSTTSTEIGYVHGVTSSIQTQINSINSSLGIWSPTTGNGVVTSDAVTVNAQVCKLTWETSGNTSQFTLTNSYISSGAPPDGMIFLSLESTSELTISENIPTVATVNIPLTIRVVSVSTGSCIIKFQEPITNFLSGLHPTIYINVLIINQP